MIDAVLRRLRSWPWAWVTAVASVIVSFGGVGWAIHDKIAADGGRGGAIGCAMTFFMLFTARPTPESALTAPLSMSDDPEPDPLVAPPAEHFDDAKAQIERLKDQVSRLRGALAAMLDQAGRGRVQLAGASVFSTMIWGFGDLVAKSFGAQ